MTKKPRLFLTLSLFAVLLASACTPAETEVSAGPSVTPMVDVPSPTLEAATQSSVDSTATLPAEALPIATSRGPNLEATDPATVSLASGELHFVEFFRFT